MFSFDETDRDRSESLSIMSFRCLLRCGPPLPIPNREVKPTSADGTAFAGEYVDAVLRALFGGPFFWLHIWKARSSFN